MTKQEIKLRNEQIIALARKQWHKDGQIEVDEGGLSSERVSEGDDNGAYVQAWVWVDFSSTSLDKRQGNQ